jgi:hypothetical protein
MILRGILVLRALQKRVLDASGRYSEIAKVGRGSIEGSGNQRAQYINPKPKFSI